MAPDTLASRLAINRASVPPSCSQSDGAPGLKEAIPPFVKTDRSHVTVNVVPCKSVDWTTYASYSNVPDGLLENDHVTHFDVGNRAKIGKHEP